MTRTDIHRPSAIDPSAYEYVAIEHDKVSTWGANLEFILVQRKMIEAHMKRTGGTYSHHEHNGNCHVCGVHCIYTVLFYHPETNVYIRTGFDCAEKMGVGDPDLFRKFRANCADALKARAGKRKAEQVLEQEGLSKAYLLSEERDEQTLVAAGAGKMTSKSETRCAVCNGYGQVDIYAEVDASGRVFHSFRASWVKCETCKGTREVEPRLDSSRAPQRQASSSWGCSKVETLARASRAIDHARLTMTGQTHYEEQCNV